MKTSEPGSSVPRTLIKMGSKETDMAETIEDQTPKPETKGKTSFGGYVMKK